MRRIAIVGPVGAGKSRLARELGALLGIRVLHLDALYWKPGWVPTPRHEHEAMQRRELAADSWIVDAQFDDMLSDWVEKADIVVFVDASAVRCLWRVGRRRLDRHAAVGVPAGTKPNPFHRSLAKFARNQWHYRTKVRRELLAELARERDGRRVVVLRRDSHADEFLRGLRNVDSRRPAGGTL